MRKTLINLCLIGTLLVAASASAMTVTYDIGKKRIGNWSGSVIHKASGCTGPSDLDLDQSGSNDTLYMCGEGRDVKGELTGDWDGNILTNISGKIGNHEILGGSLGGDYYRTVGNFLRPLWHLDVGGIGRFIFEKMPINKISAQQLTLWGQTRATYGGCLEGCGKKAGIDLYGASQSLPEPGSLSLFLIGLLATPLLLTRKRNSIEINK